MWMCMDYGQEDNTNTIATCDQAPTFRLPPMSVSKPGRPVANKNMDLTAYERIVRKWLDSQPFATIEATLRCYEVLSNSFVVA